MAYGRPRIGDTPDFVVSEVDSVREPGAWCQPSHILEVLKGALTMGLDTEVGLITGLTQMGMQQHIVLFGQPGSVPHQLRRHGERGTGGKSNPAQCLGIRVVIGADQPCAFGKNDRLGLNHTLRGEPAGQLPKTHGTSCQCHAGAHTLCRSHLDINGTRDKLAEDVMVVRCGRTARQQQFRQRQFRCSMDSVVVQICPDGVETFQPRKQGLVQGARQGAG